MCVIADPHETMKYTVYRDNSGTWEEYFSGSGIAGHTGTALFNLSSIISRLVISQHRKSDADNLIHYPLHIAKYKVTVFNPYSSIDAEAIAVYGAVGNNIFRRLQEGGTDIFKSKFFNNSRNRSLTVRTSSQHIVIRETEIMPLLFIFRPEDRYAGIVPVSGGSGVSIPLSFTGYGVAGINIEKIRKDIFLSDKCLYSEFQISIDGSSICTCSIIPSLCSETRYFRFRNSFGAYERIEISGLVEYIPETDAETFLSYDEVTDDYQFNRDRLKAAHVYEVEIGYKIPEDLHAILDLIQSGDIWIFAYGYEYGCVIENSGQVIATDKVTPGSVAVTVRLRDESLGIELDSEDLLDSTSLEWFNQICHERDAGVTETIEFTEYVCQITGWQGTAMPESAYWHTLIYGNGKFVSISSNGKIACSLDGIAWNASTALQGDAWGSLAYGGDKFIAIKSYSNEMAYSFDGIDWEMSTMPGNALWSAAVYGGDKFIALEGSGNGMVYSFNGIDWETSTMPGSESWASVAYGNGRFVAVAFNSTAAACSDDGINWLPSTLPISAYWESVKYENGYFIATASNSDDIAYSTDGTDWQIVTLPFSSNWDSIAYGNGIFVIVGVPFDALWSYNLIDWEMMPMPNNANNAIIYANNTFVAVASGDRAAYWIPFTGLAFAEKAIYKRYEGIRLIEEVIKSLLTDVDPVLTESQYQQLDESDVEERAAAAVALFDPETAPEYLSEVIIEDAKCLPPDPELNYEFEWNSRSCQKTVTEEWLTGTLPSSQDWTAVAYGNGKFVAIGGNYGGESNQAAYSSDGINWTPATMPSSEHWKSVTYGNGKFVAVASNSLNGVQVAYSSDGIDWTAAAMPSFRIWHSVTFGNGKFVAVASYTNQAAYSPDGINWAASTMPDSGTAWASVTYGGGKFVAVGWAGTVAYSSDGIAWQSATIPEANWESVAYGNGKFVATTVDSSNKIAYSSDGINWSSGTLPGSPSTWYSIAYGNGMFIAIALGGNKVARSTNGADWELVTLPASAMWGSIAYGDNKFVTVSGSGSDKSACFMGESTANTGNALAKTVTLTTYEGGSVTETQNYSILSAFNTYPAIVESDYIDMLDGDIEARANALIDYIAVTEGIDEYTENNDVIEYNTDLCPLPD
jgi:hypothetical protein